MVLEAGSLRSGHWLGVAKALVWLMGFSGVEGTGGSLLSLFYIHEGINLIHEGSA